MCSTWKILSWAEGRHELLLHVRQVCRVYYALLVLTQQACHGRLHPGPDALAPLFFCSFAEDPERCSATWLGNWARLGCDDALHIMELVAKVRRGVY